jgi:hypothetical protein
MKLIVLGLWKGKQATLWHSNNAPEISEANRASKKPALADEETPHHWLLQCF